MGDNGWNNIPDDATEPSGPLAGYGSSNYVTGLALDMKIGIGIQVVPVQLNPSGY